MTAPDDSNPADEESTAHPRAAVRKSLSQRDARKARLEQQLRANLARRKEHARSRPAAARSDRDDKND